MAVSVQNPVIKTNESLRSILLTDFKSLRDYLPINGGWGYSEDNAIVIDKNDPSVIPGIPFDGLSIERTIIEKRIYEELIIFRPENDRFSGIEWDITLQRLVENGGRYFDHIFVTVKAMRDEDWLNLKNEWESNHGFTHSLSDREIHLEKRDSKTITYDTEYWFDITSFY